MVASRARTASSKVADCSAAEAEAAGSLVAFSEPANNFGRLMNLGDIMKDLRILLVLGMVD